MTVHFHQGDLPDDLDLGPVVAVDSETLGLRFRRDPLCVVQLSAGDGDAHVVRLNRPAYDCPNLKRVLADREQFVLDADGQKEWEQINSRPARNLPGLARLLQRPSPFVTPLGDQPEA
jgi:hypothetical protein